MAVSRRAAVEAGAASEGWVDSQTMWMYSGGEEGGGVAEEVDVLVDLLDDLEGEFGDKGAVGDEEDRDFFVAMADAADDVECGALFELRIGFEIPVQQDRGVARIRGDERKTVFRRGGTDDFVAFITDGFHQPFHGTVGDGVGAADFAGNQQNPTL